MSNYLNIWPEWQVKQLIGEGAFGKVYEITRNSFGIEEHRAMKVISIPTCQAEYERTLSDGMDENSATSFYRSMVNEFVKEISILSQLRGTPNIVVYDDYKVVERTDSFGWDIYIMMELLTPLSKVLRNGKMSQQEIIKVGSNICDALTACHNCSILHRDIKIDNIFVSNDGVYKLGDFGIARKAEQTLGVYTKTGTESYMAPEVYKGEPYGKRADIYSLGMVLYRLTNNNRDPFLPPYPQPITVEDKNYSMVRRMKGEALPSPSNASKELGTVILKACAYRQDNRFASAKEFKNALLNPATISNDSNTVSIVDSEIDDKTQSAFESTISSFQPESQNVVVPSDDFSKTQSAFSGISNIGTSSAKQNSSHSNKKIKGILIAIIAAFVVVIGVAIVWIVNSQHDNNVDTSDAESENNGGSYAVENIEIPKKKVPVYINLETVWGESYKPTLFFNSKNVSDKWKDSGEEWPDTVAQTKEMTVDVPVQGDTKVELRLDGVTFYECEIDYESGTIVYEKYYKERFTD